MLSCYHTVLTIKNMSLVYSTISISYGVPGLEVSNVFDTKMEITVRYTRQITVLFTVISIKIHYVNYRH